VLPLRGDDSGQRRSRWPRPLLRGGRRYHHAIDSGSCGCGGGGGGGERSVMAGRLRNVCAGS